MTCVYIQVIWSYFYDVQGVLPLEAFLLLYFALCVMRMIGIELYQSSLSSLYGKIMSLTDE